MDLVKNGRGEAAMGFQMQHAVGRVEQVHGADRAVKVLRHGVEHVSPRGRGGVDEGLDGV